MRYVAVALVLLASCAADRPSVDAWVEERWQPIVEVVPQPENATSTACDRALGQLRERAIGLDPAPTDEVREAAHGWLNAAESLMFSCASDPDVDYAPPYENLLLRQAEVETLLAGS